jgi:uncharacterized membrane protein YfcA
MDMKRLAMILPGVVGAGFCVIEVFKIVFLLDSAASPDRASGHTQPAMFAPAVSTSWRYITEGQIMTLGITISAVLLLAAFMLFAQWRGRDPRCDDTDRQPPPRRRVFGRAR